MTIGSPAQRQTTGAELRRDEGLGWLTLSVTGVVSIDYWELESRGLSGVDGCSMEEEDRRKRSRGKQKQLNLVGSRKPLKRGYSGNFIASRIQGVRHLVKYPIQIATVQRLLGVVVLAAWST